MIKQVCNVIGNQQRFQSFCLKHSKNDDTPQSYSGLREPILANGQL